MNRDALTKIFVVVALLGALGLTMKLALDAQKADDVRRAAPELSPEDQRRAEIRQQMRQAIEAAQRQDYQTAERLLVRASEKYPTTPAIWLNLGIAYRAANKLDAADRALARVLDLAPEDWDAVAEQATIQFLRGKADLAFSLLEKIPANQGQVNARLRIDPDWAKFSSDSRMEALRTKHGVVAQGETSVRQVERIQEQKKVHQSQAKKAKSSANP